MRVFVWNLKDELGWLLFWVAGTGAITCFVVALYPAFGELTAEMISRVPIMKTILGQFAPALMDRSLLNLFLAVELYSWFGIIAGVYPLIFASSAIAGEVESRTMEILLAQPISRSGVLLGKFAAISINLVVLCTTNFLIAWATIAVCVRESPSILDYVYVYLNTYFLLLAIAGLGFLCSVLINSQRAALSVSIGLVLLGFVIFAGLSIAGVEQWVIRLTPFYYADAIKILATGEANWRDMLILALIAGALLSAALVLFRRKDILA